MRILLASTSNAGHFGPMLPFADAARRAGHDIAVAAPESFADAVKRSGYPYLPCPDIDPDQWAGVHARFLEAEPARRNEVMVTLGVELSARSILPGLLAAIDEHRPDLILREFGEFGSVIAADLRGVPLAQVLIGLDKFVDFTIPLAAPALAGFRESLGLVPDADGERLLGLPSLSSIPASIEVARSAPGPVVHRYRAVEDREAGPLPADWWPDAEGPLVYATFGTVAGSVPFAAAAFRTVVTALAELPVRLLVTVGDNGDPADWTGLPPTVHVERWVPQRDVLRWAAAMVCHGGTGTVLGGLTAGVPMVVVPQFADQPDNAERIAEVGAGLRIGGPEEPVDPAALTSAVTRVLAEPSFRQVSGDIAAEIGALPSADDAVGFLVGLARG